MVVDSYSGVPGQTHTQTPALLFEQNKMSVLTKSGLTSSLRPCFTQENGSTEISFLHQPTAVGSYWSPMSPFGQSPCLLTLEELTSFKKKVKASKHSCQATELKSKQQGECFRTAM